MRHERPYPLVKHQQAKLGRALNKRINVLEGVGELAEGRVQLLQTAFVEGEELGDGGVDAGVVEEGAAGG